MIGRAISRQDLPMITRVEHFVDFALLYYIFHPLLQNEPDQLFNCPFPEVGDRFSFLLIAFNVEDKPGALYLDSIDRGSRTCFIFPGFGEMSAVPAGQLM